MQVKCKCKVIQVKFKCKVMQVKYNCDLIQMKSIKIEKTYSKQK